MEYSERIIRVLSVDYGTEQVGLAVTDPLKLITSGLTAVNTPQLLLFLERYAAEEAVGALVVGLLKQLSNEDSAVEANIQQLLTKLEERSPAIRVHRYDERFTLEMTFQTVVDSGLKKERQQNKVLIDEINTTLTLQDSLNLAN